MMMEVSRTYKRTMQLVEHTKCMNVEHTKCMILLCKRNTNKKKTCMIEMSRTYRMTDYNWQNIQNVCLQNPTKCKIVLYKAYKNVWG